MSETQLEEVIRSVRSGKRYRSINEGLVRRLAASELAKGRREKEAIKAVRSKLHQIGGAYQEVTIDYPHWQTELNMLPGDLNDPALMDFCERMMQLHTSTRERLPILVDFFTQTLQSIAPIDSVLDLACGLNPLALPWMPLTEDAAYLACDIYDDMIAFVGSFLDHTDISGSANNCNLVEDIPSKPVQLALLLKTLPCLEQLDKDIALPLLQGINAQHLLISFPSQSLTGRRDKGMLQNYETRFRELIKELDWHYQRFEFPGELAFLINL
jgi:16S rRNA (guanine(1405)-N(7))-methyltransferase